MKRISVVLSQGQSQNPAKRQLEEDIVAGLLMEPGIDLVVVPHLYDLRADGTGMLALQGIGGNMILLGWLFERAIRWTLDRFGIRGQEGMTLLKSDDEDEDEEGEEPTADDDKERVIDSRPIPNRRIYCLDLRISTKAQEYIDEIKRIARENSMQLLGIGDVLGSGPALRPETIERFQQPTNDTFVGAPLPATSGNGAEAAAPQVLRIDESPERRWYPVIDYSRCTNCMECIDFCLFGVYGVDKVETILVEQPDNCRKGCPACSRVCPENAIIFPQHKTPEIAGAAAIAASLKIDLSKLFGAPETGESAEQAAIRERDEQLLLAGRQAVGASVGLPKRQAAKTDEPKDELDSLLDALDDANV
ncbi:MAG TPA: ferredoxin family protein [Pirellulaceae bacterium]|nr:ferredoxin family protein [Pirellulaceae bacterium]